MSLDPVLRQSGPHQRSGAERRQIDLGPPGGEERRTSLADRRAENNSLFVTFTVGPQLLGLLVGEVQEVLPPRPIAPIPLAPREITGFLNLRGQIVTAVDMRRRLHLTDRPQGASWMNVIVRHEMELFSLLVDAVGDVLEVRRDAVFRPPATLDAMWKELCQGVVKLDGAGLLLTLDIPTVLRVSGLRLT